jgi:hypothetical protein
VVGSEAGGAAVHAVAGGAVPGRGGGRGAVGAVEPVLAQFDQRQVADDHPGQGEEEQAGQRLEAEDVGERGERQYRAHQDDADRGKQ